MRVFVIYNKDSFTKEQIIEDIKEEGFPYKFCFTTPDRKENVELIKASDEVWAWGECEHLNDYKIAQELKVDIWQMG